MRLKVVVIPMDGKLFIEVAEVLDENFTQVIVAKIVKANDDTEIVVDLEERKS